VDNLYKIDKKRVRSSFGRAAKNYDAAAVMQHEVFERMFTRLDLVKMQPSVILDAGCGTGWGQARLAERYRHAQVLALDIAMPMLNVTAARASWWARLFGRPCQSLVCADIEAMPIRQNSIDMVWSNLAIQWCNDIELTFGEFHRILRPDGLLMFSTFGPDTLMELRAASGGGNRHTHVNQLLRYA